MLHQLLLRYVTRSCIQRNKKAHRGGQERTSRRASAKALGMVGNPLPTSSEDGIPEVLAEQRLGHQVPGMRGWYAHVSQKMRDELMQALQARWEESLRQRAALAPRSPVPLLDNLLAPYRPGRDEAISQISPNTEKAPIPA
jgi:hypothetical protein